MNATDIHATKNAGSLRGRFMSDAPTTVIINASCRSLRNARAYRRVVALLERALPDCRIESTAASGDAARLTRAALHKGSDRIVAVGGDGTLGEAVDGFFEDGVPIAPDSAFSYIMCGTGNDFMKTLGGAHDGDAFVAAMAKPREKQIDVGRLTYVDFHGATRSRHFLNIASFGMSGAVDRQVNRMRFKGLFGGRLTFLLATARVLLGFRNPSVRFLVDGMEAAERRIRLVIVANGRYAGGGMLFAPDALLDDGLFDVVTFGDLSSTRILRHMNDIYKGEHLNHEGIEHFRCRRVDAFSNEEVLLDVDGEALGKLPASFEIVPNVLRVLY